MVERADASSIAGWAWDPTKPNAPVEVDFVEKKAVVAKVMADQFRQDLSDGGYGNGRHYFQWTPPAAFLGGRQHEIVVVAGGKEIKGSPVILSAPGR
jgi:hypothetical protein